MDRKKIPFLMNSIKEEQMETQNGKYFFFPQTITALFYVKSVL